MIQEKISIFDVDDFSIGRKLGTLGKLYHSVLVKELKHLGIERHFSILVLLDRIGSKCSQKFIADTMHIDKAMMVGVLDNLVEKGFIRRVKNPSDRREYWIQLTGKGKRCMPEIKATVCKINDLVMKEISSYEVNRIQEYLRIMYENVISIQE